MLTEERIKRISRRLIGKEIKANFEKLSKWHAQDVHPKNSAFDMVKEKTFELIEAYETLHLELSGHFNAAAPLQPVRLLEEIDDIRSIKMLLTDMKISK